MLVRPRKILRDWDDNLVLRLGAEVDDVEGAARGKIIGWLMGVVVEATLAERLTCGAKPNKDPLKSEGNERNIAMTLHNFANLASSAQKLIFLGTCRKQARGCKMLGERANLRKYIERLEEETTKRSKA